MFIEDLWKAVSFHEDFKDKWSIIFATHFFFSFIYPFGPNSLHGVMTAFFSQKIDDENPA